jgi:enoyl-CoA hydratase/carnithine racemase
MTDLLVERLEAHTVLFLNRPEKRNALSVALRDAISDVVYGPLHDLVGGAVAREPTIGGREVDARDALALHLVGDAVEPDALRDATEAAARGSARRRATCSCAPRRRPSAAPASPPNPPPSTFDSFPANCWQGFVRHAPVFLPTVGRVSVRRGWRSGGRRRRGR